MATTTIEEARPEIRPADSYRAIRELIVLGQLAPGSRIIESDLVDRLGVDRKAVREAIERLEQEDLVVRLPGGRARWGVAPLTVADIREIYDITAELEGVAGRRAAELEPEARSKLVTRLRAISRELSELATGESPLSSGRIADLERAFHCTIVEVAGGRRLTKICESLKPQAARYAHHYSAFLFPAAAALADAHEGILQAIEGGDPDAAEGAIQQYLRAAARAFAEVMETVGERGIW